MTANGFVFNPPPGWPTPPADWVPPEDWKPDASWPPPPPDWVFWRPAHVEAQPSPLEEETQTVEAPDDSAAAHERLRVAEAEIVGLRAQVVGLRDQLARRPPEPSVAETADVVELDDERILQEVGIYRYHHPLENSDEFRDRLKALQEEIKTAVKQGDAVLSSDMFTFNNSLAKGRKLTSDLSKLMLRAYNAEADSCVRALRAGNVVTAKKRLDASVAAVARLGSIMEMRINPAYHSLRIEELELTADFLVKVQEEKEEARAERERLREERRAEQELTAERERLDKERNHYLNAMKAMRAGGDEAGATELADRLAAIDDAIAQNDFRAANIRAGYVYVISNRGAFGPSMVKIGMTRRLDPMDRVRELGDASVPFPFDVHALFFSEDAVTLESDLHRDFAEQRVNRVNERREFFFAAPAEVHGVLAKRVGNLLEFNEQPEATQYLQSTKYWPAGAVVG